MGLEGDTLVISNGEDVYVWRPKKSSIGLETSKSDHLEINSEKQSFNLNIDEYASEQRNALWLNPRQIRSLIDRGHIAKLKQNVPAKVVSSGCTLETVLKFKYRLTRPGTLNSIICSDDQCEDRKSLVEEKVEVFHEEDLIEKQVEVKKNPLSP